MLSVSVHTICDRCSVRIEDGDRFARKINILVEGVEAASVDLCESCADVAIPRILAP